MKKIYLYTDYLKERNELNNFILLLQSKYEIIQIDKDFLHNHIKNKKPYFKFILKIYFFIYDYLVKDNRSFYEKISIKTRATSEQNILISYFKYFYFCIQIHLNFNFITLSTFNKLVTKTFDFFNLNPFYTLEYCFFISIEKDPFILPLLLNKVKKVDYFFYSWDHFFKIKNYHKHQNLLYITWSSNMSNLLTNYTKLPLSKFKEIGSLQFSNLTLTNKSFNLKYINNTVLFCGTWANLPFVKQEVYLINYIINKHKNYTFFYRLYPNLSINSLNFINQHLNKNCIIEDPNITKYDSIKKYEYFIHFGTTIGLELNLSNSKTIYIDYLNTLSNFPKVIFYHKFVFHSKMLHTNFYLASKKHKCYINCIENFNLDEFRDIDFQEYNTFVINRLGLNKEFSQLKLFTNYFDEILIKY
jgi:hypothetical protein